MPRTLSRSAATAALIAVLGLSAGCAEIRDHKGYVVDSQLLATVQPGVDNRDSVTATIGRPSFASQFDKGQTWYYVSRDTRATGFSTPKASQQMLLAVRFDPRGNVVSVNRTGLETIRKVSLYRDKTPTLGSKRGFFSELFGNIGRVGSVGTNSTTADNPN